MSDDDSRSGMSSPSTRSGPSARAHNAAQTLLSTPPDSPTTTPRFRIRRVTADSMRGGDLGGRLLRVDAEQVGHATR